MLKTAPIVTVCLLLMGIGVFAVGSRLGDVPEPADPLERIALGATASKALLVMQRLEERSPAIFARARKGVGAWVDHLGFGWQFMAHTSKQDRVTDLQMLRFTRSGMRTAEQCAAVFQQKVVQPYQNAHPNGRWSALPAMHPGLDLRVSLTLDDGSLLFLGAQRDERKRALCRFNIRRFMPGTMDLSAL